MLLTRYEPFHLLDRFFEDHQRETIYPHANIIENEKEFVLEVELPGLEKKDTQIEVKDNRLTISGEKTKKVESKEEGYTRYESSYGKFSRSWSLDDGIDVEKIGAESRDGVLTITLPKKKAVAGRNEAKRIAVK